MNAITKHSAAKWPVFVSFGNDLVAGESVTSAAVTCTNVKTGQNSKTLIVASNSLSASLVTVVLQGGVKGERHRLTVTGTTSLTNIFEKNILIEIKDTTGGWLSKEPSETFAIQVDWAALLASGETIASYTATALSSAGVDLSDTLLDGGLLVSPSLYLRVMGGTNRQCYYLQIRSTSSLGYLYPVDLTLWVQEK